MLSLLGTIFGLLGSLLPSIIKLFQAKQDYAHEEKMFDLGMQAAAKEHQYKVEEMNITADIQETEALYKAAQPIVSGNKLLDGIVNLYNSSVRPTITYLFMVMYMFVKLSTIYTALHGDISHGLEPVAWQTLGPLIWNSEDFAVFSTIMAFWFGGRFMKYALGQAGPKFTVPGGNTGGAIKPGGYVAIQEKPQI